MPLHRLPAHDRDAFSLSTLLPAQGFEVTAGDPILSGLHEPTRHLFGPRCLSWLLTRSEGMDDLVNLRAAMLDEAPSLRPFVETWTREALPWARTPAVHRFEAFPPRERLPSLAAEFAEWLG